jgi:hypothetical protein
VGAAVTSALVADILLVAVGLSEAAAPQEVWPETEVTAHLQLPQPEAAKLADPPDSEVQQARQVRLLLQPPSTTQDHPRQVGLYTYLFLTRCRTLLWGLESEINCTNHHAKLNSRGNL